MKIIVCSGITVITQGNIGELLIVSEMWTPKKKILGSSNDDYHLIIKELAEEFEGQFECLGENPEKYTTSPVTKMKGNWKR